MKKKTADHDRRREKRIRLSEDLLWGLHPIYEGLKNEPERFTEIVVTRERRGGKIEEIVAMARRNGVKLVFVERLKLTGEGSEQVRHQGVLASLATTPLIGLEDLLDKAKRSIAAGENIRIMVCDSLQDPHNLGAIVRSSLASGALAVVITRERSAPLGGTAAKASAGAVSHIDICQVVNLANALTAFKEIGCWVFGAVKDDSALSLYQTDLKVPACFVVGSEGKGLRPLVKKQCDQLISIPMVASLDSLNSSVAAAVILFEAMRQNLSSSPG